ncbi:hypothetical protein F5146DRAFT_994599 [Armillaria mellea]|nr:hypothetical protein F5146DRAFT_994599 [Armillaria mellea]
MLTLKKNPKTTYSNGRIFGAACISCRQTKTKCDINNPCLSCQRRGLADKCQRVTPKTKKWARNSHEEDVVNGSNFKSPDRRVASEALQHLPFVPSSSSVIAISPIDASELAKQLPIYGKSYRLCQAYSDLAPWLFGAASAQQVMTEVLPGWYDQGLPKLEGRVDELSLLFAVLSLGALLDPAGQKAYVISQSTDYCWLSEAVLDAYNGMKSVMYTQACTLLALCEGNTTGKNTDRLQKLRSAALEMSITHDSHCSAKEMNNEEHWPNYNAILRLSCRLHKQRLPDFSQGDCPKGGQLRESLAFWLPQNYIQLAPLAHVWDYWLHIFSATVMVYLVAKKVLDSIIHQEAMTRLKSAERLFESAAMYGGRAAFLFTKNDGGGLNGSCNGNKGEGEWPLPAENNCDERQHVLRDLRDAEDEMDGYSINDNYSYPHPVKDTLEEGGVFMGKVAGGESPKCFPVIQETEGHHFAVDGLWNREDPFFDPMLLQGYANDFSGHMDPNRGFNLPNSGEGEHQYNYNLFLPSLNNDGQVDTDAFKAIESPMQGYSLFPSAERVSFDFSGGGFGASLLDALDAPLQIPFDSNISNTQGYPQPHLQQPAICNHVIETTSFMHDQIFADIVGIEMDPADGYAMDHALETWFEGISYNS